MDDDAEEKQMVRLDAPVRVLVLGNSFSVDGTAYLDELVRAAGINPQQLAVFNGSINGGGFADWLTACQSNLIFSFQKTTGAQRMNGAGTVREVLAQYWDVVVLLQASDKSYSWDTFTEGLEPLVNIVRKECPNPDVRLAYALPWGHTPQSTPKELKGNVECARKLLGEYGFDIIIPVGMAIQNARSSRLNNEHYLTRDNWHLCFGVGRYIAACTWFETLIAPKARRSVVGNTANHPLSEKERGDGHSIAVDDDNRTLCQKCALLAVEAPFEVSPPGE